MSQENVEIVRAIQPPSGTDLTALYALDSGIADRIEAVAPLFDPEFEFEVHGGVGERLRGRGLQALTEAWREWMQPFEIFRTEVEGFIDVDDDRVLVLIRDHTRPRGTDAQIESLGCNLWTLRNGRITRIDFYPTRSLGLEAAGLRE
jgi:ketosteroid isomerase-like protein